jgi:cell division protein ZapA
VDKTEVVQIFGSEYRVKADVNGERIKKIADIVDERMKEVHKNFPVPSTTKIAVLAFLNFVDEYLMKLDEHEKKEAVLEEKINSLIESIDKHLKT